MPRKKSFNQSNIFCLFTGDLKVAGQLNPLVQQTCDLYQVFVKFSFENDLSPGYNDSIVNNSKCGEFGKGIRLGMVMDSYCTVSNKWFW